MNYDTRRVKYHGHTGYGNATPPSADDNDDADDNNANVDGEDDEGDEDIQVKTRNETTSGGENGRRSVATMTPPTKTVNTRRSQNTNMQRAGLRKQQQQHNDISNGKYISQEDQIELQHRAYEKTTVTFCGCQALIIVLVSFFIIGSLAGCIALTVRLNKPLSSSINVVDSVASQLALVGDVRTNASYSGDDTATAEAAIEQEEPSPANAPREQYHRYEHFEFYTTADTQVTQRHPKIGGIPGIEGMLRVDSYDVCCISKRQSLVCARGIVHADATSLDAVLRCSAKTKECFLEVWVNGAELANVFCKLSYVLEP